MQEKHRDGDNVTFAFVCPGCGAEGDLGLLISEGMAPFGCPAGCGSQFVMWQPDGDKCVLKCVVQRFSE